jgi:hypothetical protein
MTNLLVQYRHSQPIQALEHPKFKELIYFTSCATNGIKIPDRRATRGEIKRLFEGHLMRLKAQLNVSISLGSHSLLMCFSGSNYPRRSQPNLRCMASK